MARMKHNHPRRHHVPPAILFSRKRQLLFNIIRLFQHLGVEVRINRLRPRNLIHDFNNCIPVSPNPPSFTPSLFPPFCYQEGEQTLEEDNLPDTPNPNSPDILAPDKDERTPTLNE